MEHQLDSSLKCVIESIKLGKKVEKRNLVSLGMPNDLADAVEAAQQVLLTDVKTPRQGLFVVVSGIDKSGKETHSFNPVHRSGIFSIEEFLTVRGLSVKRIFQPSYDTPIGSVVYNYLRQSDGTRIVDDKIAWVLWSLDRAQHNALVASWLEGPNNVVLAKRWTESNLVYQGALGIDVKDILYFERNIIRPDLMLILDITPETFMKRLTVLDADSYEKLDLMEKARRGYIDVPFIYESGSWIYIDSNYCESDVNRTILGALDIYLKQRGF